MPISFHLSLCALIDNFSLLQCVVLISYIFIQLGRICLDILKDKWSPALQIRTVLLRYDEVDLRNYNVIIYYLFIVLSLYPRIKFWTEFCDIGFYLLLCVASIQALLSAPNPDDPLSENIAKHWKSNEAEAVETGIAKSQFCPYLHN